MCIKTQADFNYTNQKKTALWPVDKCYHKKSLIVPNVVTLEKGHSQAIVSEAQRILIKPEL